MAPHDRHGCDEHTRLRRRALLRPTGVVPIPADALEHGAAAFLAERRTRREALVGGVGLAVGLAGLARLGPHELLLRAAEAEAAGPANPILVSVFLDGGNDGLNTLVPRTGTPDRAIYDANRLRLGLAETTLLPVTGDHATTLGWNPHASGLKDLHDAGLLSIFPATDYPKPDYSHFHSGHFWRTGVLDRSYSVDTGWLGRYLDLVGSPSSPLQGVTIDWSSDEVLIAKRAATAVVHSPQDFAVSSPDVRDPRRLMATLARLGGPARTEGYRQARDQARQTERTWRALDPLATAPEETVPTPYPDGSELGSGLRNLARMLGAGLGVRVATISQTGYDTHDGQDERHPALLADLGASLRAWQDDLTARGLHDRVLTLIWSEFGRRVADNESLGTDHGAGGLVMLLGTHLNAGIHADAWNLAGIGDLDGNIPVQTDFRDVYAGVLQEHLGIEAARVLPGYAGAPVQVRG
jgi:uncharacterized protein (DUF1501 family)